MRDKVFDPFFTTKEPGKGTGLGLSQVRSFVTRFGGYCTIDSEPGAGTVIRLFLPRYKNPAADTGSRRRRRWQRGAPEAFPLCCDRDITGRGASARGNV